MKMLKAISRLISNNIYILIGILLGLYLSSLLQDTPLCSRSGLPSASHLDAKPQSPLKVVVPTKVSNATKKNKLVRPRYYSTELGIREKLFVGIFSSEEKVNSQVVHLNKTIHHLVNQIKFFITAQYKLKTKFNLSGLVGFTDTRSRYRPFQVLKYIGDNFGQDYDYYFLANDYTFINGHKVNDMVRKISVSMDVYLGKRVEDGSFCNIDSGILLSNSVVKAVRNHLDWCIINAISDDPSENIGRCIYHSIGLSCQESLQGQKMSSFKLKHFELHQHLHSLSKRDDFNEALTIHPIFQSDQFYLLNAYFLKQRLETVKKEIDILSDVVDKNVWPPGQRPGAKPFSRFDLPKQLYFNMTHMFLPDDFINVQKHSSADLEDIENILEEVKLHFKASTKYQFRRLINGYRIFDLSRGMDYIIDIGLRDLNTGKEVIKRFEICKPLGKVEFVPVPYVTENTRIAILLPVQETEVGIALEFLNGYVNNILQRKEKSFVMLVLQYASESENKGVNDVFGELKNFALKISNKYKHDDAKIAWLSVRLPPITKPNRIKSLNFAIIDLALKKLGGEALILVLDPYSNVTGDFLNRVRMNTLPDFQIFSPIPFRQYNPKLTQTNTLDISKNSGHFDKEEYKYVSFYGSDYIKARRLHQHKLPIVRVDNDIEKIVKNGYENIGNVFEMFVKFGGNIHPMRATEMGLKIKYHSMDEDDPGRCKSFLGNKAQLGRLLLEKAPNLV